MRFGLSWCAVCVVATTAMAVPARAQLVQLPSSARAINNAGQVVGGDGEAWVWSASTGRMDLGCFGGGTALQAAGISENGTIIGYGDIPLDVPNPMLGDLTRAIRWNSELLPSEAFPLTAGRNVQGIGINSAGRAIGVRFVESAPAVQFMGVAVEPSGQWRDLFQVSGGQWVIPSAINERGDVAITAGLNGYMQTSVFGLAQIAPLPGSVSVFTAALNDSGAVGGYCGSSGPARAFLWTEVDGTIELPSLPGGSDSRVRGLNNAGWAVGSCRTTTSAGHAVAWMPTGQIIDLNTLLTPAEAASGLVLFSAIDINDSGQAIVLGRIGPSSQDNMWFLVNIPGPGAASLLGVSAMMGVGRARRGRSANI